MDMYWELEPKLQVQQSTKGFHQDQVVLFKEGKKTTLMTKESYQCSLIRADQFHSKITPSSSPFSRKYPELLSPPFPHKIVEWTLTIENCNIEHI